MSILFDTKLWISGGRDDDRNYLSSSEFIYLNGTREEGPELPKALWKHVMININDTFTMIVGGSSEITLENESIGMVQDPFEYTITRTTTYDHTTKIWRDGPKLNKPRQDHAIGTVIDEATLVKLIFVTGGYHYQLEDLDYVFNSTEFLFDNTWTLGESKNTGGWRGRLKGFFIDPKAVELKRG